MTSTTTLLTLYSIAGLLEVAGVSITAFDVRQRLQQARQLANPPRPDDPTAAMWEGLQTNTAASQGMVGATEMRYLKAAVLDILQSRLLALAAALLIAGVVVGTIANALSAARG